jgi:hypothetical protein
MINDLCLVFKHSLPVLYADDDTVLIAGPPDELLSIINQLEEDLSRAVTWVEDSRLSINDDKTEIMFIGKKCDIKNTLHLTVSFNNKPIKRVDSMKILGVVIDSNLKWDKQLAKVSNSCNYSMSLLRPLRGVLSYTSKKLLISALTLSHLHYVSSVWFNCNSTSRKAINQIFRSCAKFVLCKNKYDSISSELTNELKWLNCNNRRKFETLKLAFHMIHDSGPAYFRNYLSTSNFSLRETRRGTHVVHTPNIKCWWGERSFRHSASKLWFELPEYIKSCDYYPRFKFLLFSLLICDQSSEAILQHDDNVCDLSCIDSVISRNNQYDEP